MVLSTIEKIKILTKAKNLCLNDKRGKFMCCEIIAAIDNFYKSKEWSKNAPELSEIIELFTRENAFKVCEAANVTLPRMESNVIAWWIGTEETARVTFFDWMIKQYSLKFVEELPIQDKINILEIAKERTKTKIYPFMCNNIKQTIIKYAKDNFDVNLYESVSYYLLKPFVLFTIENAIMVCQKYKLKLPDKNLVAWWNGDVIKSRLAVYNWLIREYKKQL